MSATPVPDQVLQSEISALACNESQLGHEADPALTKKSGWEMFKGISVVLEKMMGKRTLPGDIPVSSFPAGCGYSFPLFFLSHALFKNIF